MVNLGYPYNDIVICKDSTDYLQTTYNKTIEDVLLFNYDCNKQQYSGLVKLLTG